MELQNLLGKVGQSIFHLAVLPQAKDRRSQTCVNKLQWRLSRRGPARWRALGSDSASELGKPMDEEICNCCTRWHCPCGYHKSLVTGLRHKRGFHAGINQILWSPDVSIHHRECRL
ncbi:unnamed protein product [Periconia digitata]|uniref:Uncharacterized protein n=1 Tax=Periconia digitata TaxID=1303443 RepID=A0A9W4UG79_9PLEO|nr:unnamed protein product [Periconia digitata]